MNKIDHEIIENAFAAASEEQAKAVLLENFVKFSPELQQTIAGSLFENSLDEVTQRMANTEAAMSSITELLGALGEMNEVYKAELAKV